MIWAELNGFTVKIVACEAAVKISCGMSVLNLDYSWIAALFVVSEIPETYFVVKFLFVLPLSFCLILLTLPALTL